MIFQRFSDTLSRFAFLATVLLVSVTLSGYIFLDALAHELNVNISIFEIDLYSLLGYFLRDLKGVYIAFLIGVFCLSISATIFPKSINWFLSLGYFLLLNLQKILTQQRIWKFFRFLNKLSLGLLKKIFFLIDDCIEKIKQNTQTETEKVQEKFDFKEANRAFNYSYYLALFLLGVFLFWLTWMAHFGEVAKNYANLLKQHDFTHTIYLVEKDEIKHLDCTFVSKIKNGYLVMAEQEKQKVATIFTDNFVYKIEPKKKPA